VGAGAIESCRCRPRTFAFMIVHLYHWFDENEKGTFYNYKKIQFENNEFLIVKVVLERGGSN
jgi:hypothetical protein